MIDSSDDDIFELDERVQLVLPRATDKRDIFKPSAKFSASH